MDLKLKTQSREDFIKQMAEAYGIEDLTVAEAMVDTIESTVNNAFELSKMHVKSNLKDFSRAVHKSKKLDSLDMPTKLGIEASLIFNYLDNVVAFVEILINDLKSNPNLSFSNSVPLPGTPTVTREGETH